MSVVGTVAVIESQQWPQGDARDPLGVWGGRALVVGDASGGEIGAEFFVPADKTGSFVYTCYAINGGQVLGSLQNQTFRIQLLTNFPNIDPQPGVQGFSTLDMGFMGGDGGLSAPFSGQRTWTFPSQNRFVLLYDPSPRNTDMNIVRLFTVNQGGVGVDFIFECYGYYWDRSVLNTPGGPRHPGSS